MKVDVQYAETHLAALIFAASRGEVVEIEGEQTTAQIIAFPKSKPADNAGRRILGAGRGEMRVPSLEEWGTMDKELERRMNDGSLFPDQAQ